MLRGLIITFLLRKATQKHDSIPTDNIAVWQEIEQCLPQSGAHPDEFQRLSRDMTDLTAVVDMKVWSHSDASTLCA